MSTPRKKPFRKVTEATLQDDDLGRWWCLVLECGHGDVRQVTYTHKSGILQGGNRHHGAIRALEDAKPHPHQIRCDQCRQLR